MNTALWIVQGLLGALFTMAGFTKATQTKEKLAKQMPWVNDYADNTVKLIGISQLLGGIGLIVPQLTGIAPVLSPLAAAGLALTMVLAALYHLRKGEYKEIAVNLILLSLNLFVVYGRLFYTPSCGS